MSGRRVLVADDEAHLTYILSFKLRQAGLEVVTASDGEEAFALACEHVPDLIITDFQMPLMSGVEFCIKLRENGPTSEVPVIMLTGRGHKVPPSDLARTNIQHLLPKPFSGRELLARVAEFIPSAAPADAETTPGTAGRVDAGDEAR